MATKQTFTYDDYLAALPPERSETVKKVWQAVRENIRPGFTEQATPKFLTFMDDGEMYLALGNQKNYISLYLIPVYCFPEVKAKLDASGKKLKMGKSCINFLSAEELPLDAISEIVRSFEPGDFKRQMEHLRREAKEARKQGKGK